MPRLVLFFSFLFCLSMANAQYQQLDEVSHNISAQIDLVNGQLTSPGDQDRSSSMIRDLDVSLMNGEIVIDYNFARGDKDQNYIVNLKASLNGEELVVFREDLIGAINTEIPASADQSQQIIWTHLFDRYVDMNGTLLLSLNVQLWGQPQLPFGIECGVPPEFTMKQKLPYFIAAGVGVASLGASLIFKSKSEDTYDNEYLTQNFQEAAEPFYQKANDDHHKSLIFRYAGIGVLAIDAGLYIFRTIRHQRKKDAYNEYCRDLSNIQVQPVVEIRTSGMEPGQLGLRMTYTFGQ